MGWASGFQAGSSMAKQWLDTYEKANRKRLFEEAQKDVAFQKYSPEQAAQMRAESEMKDEYGNPLYEFTIEPGSTTYTRRALSYPTPSTTTEGLSFGAPEEPRVPLSTAYAVPQEHRPYSADLAGETYYAPTETPRGLSTPEYGISRPIESRMVSPEETAAYRGLTTMRGEPTAMTPELTQYLGQTVKGGLTKDMQQAMLLNRYADIISREDPVEGLRLKTMAAQEARAAQGFEIQQKLANLQVKAAERGEKFSAAEDKLIQDLKTRPELLSGNLNNLFTSYGIPIERGYKLVEAYNGIESGSINRSINQVKKAFLDSRGNLDTFLEKTLSDKDYDPNSHMVKRRGPNGGIIIDVVETLPNGKAGRVLSSLPESANDAEAMDNIFNTLTNPGNVAATQLKNEKARQEIAYMKQHGQYFADVGEAYRTGMRGGGGRDRTESDISTRINSITSALKENRETIKDIDDQLEKLGGRKDQASQQKREALTKQRNDINAESDALREEHSQLRNERSKYGGSGGGLSKQPTRMYQAGDVETYTDPKTGEQVKVRFKGGENKQENWEVITGESTPTAPAKEGGLSKPSRGMTDAEYENWIDEKLIGTFTSRVAQLQSIIKDNPNPKIREAAKRMLEKEKSRPAGGGVDMPL